MNKNIGIIGGDLRIFKLGMLLAKDNYMVHTYAIEEAEYEESIRSKIRKYSAIEQVAENVDTIISSIPLTRDGETVVTPLSQRTVMLEEMLGKITNKTIIAGDIKEPIYKMAKDNNVKMLDILEEEELAVLNAIPTAEGALQVAMEEAESTLHGSNVLVLGYGRIAKILSKMLFRNRSKCILCCQKNRGLSNDRSYGICEDKHSRN